MAQEASRPLSSRSRTRAEGRTDTREARGCLFLCMCLLGRNEERGVIGFVCIYLLDRNEGGREGRTARAASTKVYIYL